ncbi:MAG TPA: alpha/beta fold hydrolase [Candidatus Binatia bacterium]|nr:alpha/beta fold hydrolase [Candidatus Binatia bacterium]
MNHDRRAEGIPPVTVNAAGINTSYYEAGRGKSEPVLLLHGMSASADTFRELMAALGQDHWTVAPDIPGFGDSGNMQPYTFPHLVDWLNTFLEKIEVPPAHFVGHSFGGALAVSYALAHPEKARTLILLAPSVLRPGKYPEWLRKFAQSSIAEWILGLGVSASRLMLNRQMRAAFYDPSGFEPSLWERRRRDYDRARASAAVLRASALHDVRDELDCITQPSCIIWGKNDPVLDSADAVVLNNLMPDSYTYLHLLPECGHLPHIEQEERVVDIITRFLADG